MFLSLFLGGFKFNDEEEDDFEDGYVQNKCHLLHSVTAIILIGLCCLLLGLQEFFHFISI